MMNRGKKYAAVLTFALTLGGFVPAAGTAYPLAPRPAMAAVMDYSLVRAVLKNLAGSWSDDDGNLAAYVSGNYFNDCEVIAGHDFVGSPVQGGIKLELREAGGSRTIWLAWSVVTENGQEPYLIINQGKTLRR